MARGNDGAAALAELRGRFAGSNGSAEDLIQGSRAAQSPELRHASGLARETEDGTPTGKPVEVDLDKVQDKVGDGATVLSAAKRGPFVVAVIETESGHTFKDVFAANDVGFSGKRNQPRELPSNSDDVDRDGLLERMGATSEATDLARKAEEAAEEARQKVYEQALKGSGSSSSSSSSSGSGSSSRSSSSSSSS